MRSLLEVDRERQAARTSAGGENTVHRSSLLVPAIHGHRSVISFLNHFLIKRNIPEVSCRIVAIDAAGKRIAQRTVTVNEPRVYSIDLNDLFPGAEPNNFVVEFYSSKNLAIPFPAVMINHYGNGTVNMVHAYNRVLNDVFEQDSDVDLTPAESSIDVRVEKGVDTFAIFASGPAPFKGKITFELEQPGGKRTASLQVDMPRLTQRQIALSEVFPDLTDGESGILRILAPRQFLFFGRMLAGQKSPSGAFAANHTYYDGGTTQAEYFPNNTPSRYVHSLVPGMSNAVRFYPFFSKSKLDFTATLHDRDGTEVDRLEMGQLESPSSAFLTFNVNDAMKERGIDASKIAAFGLEAAPVDGNTPTRIPHQRIFSKGHLEASVVLSLHNENRLPPMRGFVWGQLIAGSGLESYLGISRNHTADPDEKLLLQLYGEAGKLHEAEISIAPNSGRSLKLADVIPDAESGEPSSVWFLLTGTKPDFSAISVVADREANCTAEHAF
jgi:hypothetical protein